MFSVTVTDHMMIAHSLAGEVFGPAQALHGATFVVEVTFRRAELDADGIVVDIGAATTALGQILAAWKYQNLDDLPAFDGVNTTTERLCKAVFDAVAQRIKSGELGAEAATALDSVGVILRETPNAWASYEAALD